MIRLTFSDDRGELEALEGKLDRAGIQSEVRSNPVADLLGVTRFDIFVRESDLAVASEVCRGVVEDAGEEDRSNGRRNARGAGVSVRAAQTGLLLEAKVVTSPATGSSAEDAEDGTPTAGETKSECDLTRASTLLEEEVEALLARESKLAERCAALEERLETVEQELARTEANLAREQANRTAAEKKLTETEDARGSLEKEMQDLELRLKTSEQTLAATHRHLDLQAQQQEQWVKERKEEQALVQANVGTLNDLRGRLRARLAGEENQRLPVPPKGKRRLMAEE